MNINPSSDVVYNMPVFYTPATRLCVDLGTAQKSNCAAREMDWIRCSARVGEVRRVTECKEYLDDFKECMFKTKAMKRYHAMYEERKRQGRTTLPPPPGDMINLRPDNAQIRG